jgi:hypothetical protein
MSDESELNAPLKRETQESPLPAADETPGSSMLIDPRRHAKLHEVAVALRANSIGWIASADSKATTIASVLAVVLGLVSIEMAKASRDASLEFVYWAFLGLGAVTVVLCVFTLWPRTDRRSYVPHSPLSISPTFFGDVPSDYKTYQDRIARDLDLEGDMIEQAFVVACIAKEKMILVRVTIVAFALTLMTLSMLAFFTTRTPAPCMHSEQPPTGAETR